MTNTITTYSRENGGRVLILFLLFLLAIFQLINAGFSSFAIICLLPITIPIIYIAFSWKMAIFWFLFFTNYFIQFFNKNQLLPHGIPMSLYNELLEIILLAIVIIDQRYYTHFERILNLMFLAILIWCGFCTIELFNDTCDLGINLGNWYTGARMMAFQILYAFLVCILFITCPDSLNKYLKLWACLCIFSFIWTWKQQHIGFTPAESIWMETRGRTTHILNGGTLIRYFSTFNDAASYGCNAAASGVAFFIFAITSKIKMDRYFYFATAILITWGMFASGTRTSIFCMIAGFIVFLVLSKSIRIIIPSAIIGGFLLALLIFTNIGQGNQQIRRMRSAFNKNDASANVRDINKAAIRKYIVDAPWGIGIGSGYENIPANNKFRKLSTIPPDSEYVYIWVHTGPIGLTVFILTTILMLLGACCIVFFRLKNRSLIGIGAGLCSAFVAIHVGGYANGILLGFPNCFLFYGGLAIVYTLPFIEPSWIELENKRFAEQEEKKRIKLENKFASRV